MARSGSTKNRKRASPSVQLVAGHVLRDVIDQLRSLDRTLESEASRLKPDQRPVLMELAYGGCRQYFYLDGILSQLLTKPIRRKDRMVHFLLIVGLYQLAFMRVPDHAAVDETVKALEASKQSWARGLVNGVLRTYLRRRDDHTLTDLEQDIPDSAKVSFPPFLYSTIEECWTEHAGTVYRASIQKPPMTLRVNCQKTTPEDYLGLLGAKNIGAESMAECSTAINLEKPAPVEQIPMFADGWVSVQDLSAQLCTDELFLAADQRVLDACAAPGGKTCAILETEPSVKLTAVD
ncbi:MAG: transcription antitermination factor NusB, partial [bacterium]